MLAGKKRFIMIILQTPTFKKQVKKLHPNQKRDLDLVIAKIISDPYIGEAKKGDLEHVL